MEQWRAIPEFPQYSVSCYGRVRNDETGRLMALLVNQRGVVNVGLTRNKVQYKRSLTPLVARAFVAKPVGINEPFDTPINLDGDRRNNCADNIVWRPYWFAVKYFRQFREPGCRGFSCPIEDTKTGEVFHTSWDAATKYGLIDREILIATLNHTYVWPTYQLFRVLN